MPLGSFQDGGCRGAAIGTQEMDPLFRECDLHHLLGGFVRIRSDSLRVRQRGLLNENKLGFVVAQNRGIGSGKSSMKIGAPVIVLFPARTF